MSKLTARGEAVAAGLNALAVDGDDALDRPAGAADTADAEPTGEAETSDPGAAEPAPGPADIPAPPVVETADDAGAATREARPAP